MEPRGADFFDHEVCKPFFHEGSDNGVLLIHGFTGSASHMRKIADELARRGYTVRTINLPGHATTEADMGKCDWKMWLEAAKQAAAEMMERCRVFTVCGLSMGGDLALLIAEQMKVDACVPISAPMATQNKLLPLAKVVAPVYKRIAWGPAPERAEMIDPAYDYGYDGFPTAKGGDLHKLIQLARRNLFAVQCPILCVQSDADETVWAGSADCILNGVGSKDKQKLWLHGVPHVCTLSREWENITNAMDDLMKRVGQAKA